MPVPLSPIDNAVADMGITCAYLFALPANSDESVGTALLADLEAATKRVVAKWTLLQGQAVWQKEKGIWAVDVPDVPPAADKPSLFTSSRVSAPYATAASRPAPVRPLSRSTSPCAFQPAHSLSFFRARDLPTTFSGYAKSGSSLLAVHATLFADALAVGVTAPHGLLDATGLGWAIRALRAELRGESWDAPPLVAPNPLSAALDAVRAEEPSTDEADVRVAQHALAGWVAASSVGNVARFLASYAWEKLWHRDEPRHVFLSKRAVDALVESVKEEVRRETDGKEWVSTGDVLTAWVLKAAHADEASSGGSAAVSPVYALRDILAVASYPHNAVAPYPFSPSPLALSALPSLSLAHLALTHRRSLAAARTRPFLRATLEKMDTLSWSNGGAVPLMPERGWPWRAPWSRKGGEKPHHWIVSNQMVSGVADLAIPIPASAAGKSADSDDGTLHDVALDPVTKGDLPLLGFYMRITAPIKDHQAFRFQVNNVGVFFEGSMRRKRWESVGRAVEQLEREFGQGGEKRET
ncbi:hypothetical protein JCM10450v2_004632 [Rhodotorula kratochvilovae]